MNAQIADLASQIVSNLSPTLAVVWHFWIAVLLVPPSLGFVAYLIFGYITKVVKPRYPKKQ